MKDENIVDEAQQINEALAKEVRESKRLDSKPNIDHLQDAVETKVIDGKDTIVFLPVVGQRIVVERRSNLITGNPWLDTRVWVVNGVNPTTGQVNLWCEDLMQNASCNFIHGPKIGYRFKLVPVKGPVFARKRRERSTDDESDES